MRVHVQDGGSSDETLKIARAWEGRGVSVSSEPDEGIYDALNKAAERLRANEIMTWLGFDDLLMPDTLATVASIFDQLGEVQWVTGQPFVGLDGGGSFTPPCPPFSFARNDLAAGKHDGRAKHFVMQEGTFWRSELWRKVAGANGSLKYAGDWDLWRRFAQHAPLYAVTFPLARFTRRKGQKSEDLASYYREIDSAPKIAEVADFASYQVARHPWNDRWEVKVLRPNPLWHCLRRSRLAARLRSASQSLASSFSSEAGAD